MILFNKTWTEEVLSRSLLDIVQPSVNPNVYCGVCSDATSGYNAVSYVDGICTASLQQFGGLRIASSSAVPLVAKIQAIHNEFKSRVENFSLVTEKFIKVLDKFYKKLYHEDFTQNVFYSQHILSIFQGIAKPSFFITNASYRYYNKNYGNPQILKDLPLVGTNNAPVQAGINPNDFKIVIDRMISLGLMDEEDRLDIKDQCFLTGLKRTNIQIIDNKEEKTIDIICNKISDTVPDIKTENLASLEGVDQTGVGMSSEHAFHKDKRLFLMYTPYLKNETTVKYGNTATDFSPEEPTTLQVHYYDGNDGLILRTTSHEPISYFKPKTYQTKFNKGSMPMATHLIWRIGTQETRETAINENSPFVPEVIFDHVDRISHIDNFKLRIKYNVVRF